MNVRTEMIMTVTRFVRILWEATNVYALLGFMAMAEEMENVAFPVTFVTIFYQQKSQLVNIPLISS